MRSLIPWRGDAAPKPARRRWRVSPWKLATWTALAAPWIVIGGLIGGGAWVVWSKGGPDSFAAKVRSEAMLASLRLGFEIDEVWVDGLARSDRNDVLAAIGAIRGEPILEFDAAAARTRLIALPWVKDAVVALALPRQVHVALTEREPMALWQLDGKLQVIDQDGKPIPGVAPKAFAHLPVMVGRGAAKAADDLLALVATAPAIAERMTAAVYVGERRWNIRIDDRIDVRLPADAVDAALQRLAGLQQEHGLFGKDILAIDLRAADRLIVRVAERGEASRRNTDRGRQGRPS